MSDKKHLQPKIDWGFYAITPRIVRTHYKELSHTEKWLYTCLKDLCGDKGTCFRSLRSLEEETDISIASLSKMIPHLHSAGLIHAEKKRRSASGKEIWHISIIDIWQKNSEYCADCSKNKQTQNDEVVVVQNLNNDVQKMNNTPGDCSENERGCSNFSDRRITIKNNNNEEYLSKEENTTHMPTGNASTLADISLDALLAEVERRQHTPAGTDAPDPGVDASKSIDTPPIAESTPTDAPTEKKEETTPGARSKLSLVPASEPVKPKRAKAQKQAVTLTTEEQTVYDFYCHLWFVAVPPPITETVKGHCHALVPYIKTQEDMDSLEKVARQNNTFKSKVLYLGNLVNCINAWMQTRGQANKTPLPRLQASTPGMTHDEAIQLASDIVTQGKEHGYDIHTQAVSSKKTDAWIVKVLWGDEGKLTIRSRRHWQSEFAEIHATYAVQQQKGAK